MVPALTTRQEQVLSLLIHEYVTSPAPVSSSRLVDRYDLGVSSATVRNDMASLEKMGLLAQPHTSAGRVPTDEGYRYFVQGLIGSTQLAPAEKRTIRHQFHQVDFDYEHWLRLAAAVLARTARSVSLITSQSRGENYYKHLALIVTEARMVLMVLVLDNGDVLQQMITLDEPVGQEELSQVADRLNQMCGGLAADDVLRKCADLPVLEREIGEQASDMLARASTQQTAVFHDGLVNILDEPEMESEGVRQTMRVLEEREMLEDVLGVMLAPGVDDVQVVIAGEGRWEALSYCSIVVARYGVRGRSGGALGVLGPTRMRYARAISAVRYVSEVMNDMLIDVYGPEPD